MSGQIAIDFTATVGHVPIRARDGEVRAHALVDAADLGTVLDAGPWSMNSAGYVKHHTRGTLHRFLLRPPELLVVDHINGDRLDNRRENLRACTLAENNRNRTTTWGASKFHGVQQRAGKWVAKIRNREQRIVIGIFKDQRTAALARDEAARAIHGEFASLNFREERCPTDLALYVQRKLAGLCTLCGEADHRHASCSLRATAERCDDCGRPHWEKHAPGCMHHKPRACGRCGEPGHYAPTCGKRDTVAVPLAPETGGAVQ